MYFMKNVSVVEHEDVCAALVSAFPERTTSDCFSVLSEDGCRLDHYFGGFLGGAETRHQDVWSPSITHSKGPEGKFWKAKLIPMDQCECCKTEGRHSPRDPCVAWQLVGQGLLEIHATEPEGNAVEKVLEMGRGADDSVKSRNANRERSTSEQLQRVVKQGMDVLESSMQT
jgi:hypothetical protein